MLRKSMNIADYDPVLWQAIQDETAVKKNTLN